MSARSSFNPKRKLQAPPADDEGRQVLASTAKLVRYTGSPNHKKNPGDFGLEPPAAPRLGATLCDGVVGSKAEAQALLSEGYLRGLISQQVVDGWPQNIWAVTNAGVAVEAQLENKQLGSYHGYPMTDADPFRREVIRRW